MRIPLWLKIGWTLWLGVWMPYYWMQYGPQNFLYFCDIANLLIGLPLCFLWRPGFNVNWVRGPFYKEQHIVPPVIYLAAYMLALPLLVYLPTHWVLDIWDRSRDRK